MISRLLYVLCTRFLGSWGGLFSSLLYFIISACKVTDLGKEYIGQIAEAGGMESMAWTASSPTFHTFTEDDMFPDATVADAENFCRYLIR